MISKVDYFKAAWQWFYLVILSGIGILVGLLLVYPIACVWLKIKHQVLGWPVYPSKFGESATTHSSKYRLLGSSGRWSFWNIGGVRQDNLNPNWWWLWGNDEDGFLGEPSGKHSARCHQNHTLSYSGKLKYLIYRLLGEDLERSWFGMYLWCMRNPFNNAKRYWRPMSCEVEKCKLDWVGNSEHQVDGAPVLDDNQALEGWYFIRGVNQETGNHYYSFRLVKQRKNGKIIHILFGFKIKPTHAGVDFDADDEQKGFTFRITFWANAN